ncbi:unnamed protein product [Pleuronectes platessa]|uniref:Uncharacterized protein n=1 Tax=Pleuronectes platessa TaxID=8262 RepID=A0A9N7VSA5_PLEPL|nr:unnamed protein product [Pleuronectes platessa]
MSLTCFTVRSRWKRDVISRRSLNAAHGVRTSDKRDTGFMTLTEHPDLDPHSQTLGSVFLSGTRLSLEPASRSSSCPLWEPMGSELRPQAGGKETLRGCGTSQQGRGGHGLTGKADLGHVSRGCSSKRLWD